MKPLLLSILLLITVSGMGQRDATYAPSLTLSLYRDTLRNIQTVSYMDHGRQKMISFHEPIFLTTKPYYCKEHNRIESLYYWPSGVQVKVIGYKQNNEWIIADAWSDRINK